MSPIPSTRMEQRGGRRMGPSRHPPTQRPSRETSARMRRVRSRGTGLEAAMESLLRELGTPFEHQPRLPGHPDFRLVGTNVLVFCDSAFWHGRNERDRSGASFRRNRAFWIAKLEANRRRRVNRLLRHAGWTVLRFWDDDVLKNPRVVKKRVERFAHAVR